MAQKRNRRSTKRMERALPKSFREACESLGYDPAEALILFRQMAGEKVAELLEHAQAGTGHPDYPGMKSRYLMEEAIKEMAALAEWDIKFLPYAYAKPQAVELTGRDGGPIEIHEVRRIVVDPD